MSYILEALKKAQAQRQLGATPTIHALPIQREPGADSTGRVNKPLWWAMGIACSIVALLLILLWGQRQPILPAPAALAAAPGIAPVVPFAPVVPVVPVVPVAPVAPVALVPAPAVAPPIAPLAVRPEGLAVKSVKSVKSARPPAAPAPVPAPVPVSAALPEDTLQTLRDLPEAIQREIPGISVGGYIYSKNPADRLLLIDKVLRHEGEELAPGLMLEKLLPKAAVLNYKGYRYRLAY